MREKLIEKGFGFFPELTAKISNKGIRIYETPISHKPRTSKEGKKIMIKDGISHIYILFKEFLIAKLNDLLKR